MFSQLTDNNFDVNKIFSNNTLGDLFWKADLFKWTISTAWKFFF